jgi:hypothetical protein
LSNIETIFAAQDFLFSSLYVHFFWKYINDVPEWAKRRIKHETSVTFGLLIVA